MGNGAGMQPPRRATKGRRGQVLLKVAGLAAVLVAGGLVAANVAGRSRDRDEGVRATRDLTTVSRTDFDITTSATGELEARNQIEISSKLETRSTILEIVKEGTRVKKGDVLIRLNSEEIQREIDTQRLEVLEAQNNKDSAEADVQNQQSLNDSELRKAELKVQLAELALRQWKEGELEKKYTQLKLDIESAERQFDRLTEKFRNSEELLAQGFLSKDERDQDEIELINAESKLQTALLDEEIFWTYEFPKEMEQKTSDLTEARAELDRVRTTNDIQMRSKLNNLENRRQQFAQREKRLRELEEQFASCTITAPADGLVVYATSNDDFFMRGGDQGPLTVGREVHPNEPLIRLPDTSEIIAKVRVHERLAGQVRPGQFARVKVEALAGAEFTGEVDSVGVLAEQVWRDNRKEYTVRIALKEGEMMERLKPTGGCEAEIRIGSVEDALAVPVQAVFSDGPVRFVYAPRGGKFVRVPIKQGQHSKTFVEVVAGLKEGQSVLLREPSPAEVAAGPWDVAALKLVGLDVNDKGEPVAPPGARGMPGAGGGRSRPGGGRPGGAPSGMGGPGAPAAKSGPTDAGTPVAQDQPKPEADAAKPAESNAEPAPAPAPAPSSSESEAAPAPSGG